MTSSTLTNVADQMRALLPDDPPLDLVLDGKRRYFGSKKKSWYRLREFTTHGNSRVVIGAFGNFSASKGGKWKVDVDWKGISAEERQALQQQRAAAADAERAQRVRDSALAAMGAADLWRTAAPAGRSPYLQRKLVDGEACRYLADGSIVVPLLRYDLPREEALKAVQRIYADGTKRFSKGFAKARCALRLGAGVTLFGEPILVCEGYATGLTIRMATERRLMVFVALDAGNLVHVCEVLRELYPQHRLLICADDDWRTTGNPGRDMARSAAKAVGRCDIVWPVFAEAGAARADKDTDFNDLHVRCGLGVVSRQLLGVLQAMRSAGRV